MKIEITEVETAKDIIKNASRTEDGPEVLEIVLPDLTIVLDYGISLQNEKITVSHTPSGSRREWIGREIVFDEIAKFIDRCKDTTK
jgi:hypothetical protein